MKTALYRHFDADGMLLYVGISKNPKRRMSEHSSRAAWFSQIAHVAVEWLDSRTAALLAERRAILSERPEHNSSQADKTRGAAAFIDAYGKEELASYFGVTFSAVRNAHWRDQIPASWAQGISLICRDLGLYCPMHAFNWRRGKGDRRPHLYDHRCVSEVMQVRDNHLHE